MLAEECVSEHRGSHRHLHNEIIHFMKSSCQRDKEVGPQLVNPVCYLQVRDVAKLVDSISEEDQHHMGC